jgi:hypothetical protein
MSGRTGLPTTWAASLRGARFSVGKAQATAFTLGAM